MQKYTIFCFLIGFSVLLFSNCATVQYGCLDPYATNYDPGADKDCSAKANQCSCTYPQLRLEVTILRGTEKGFRKDTLTDINNHKFYLEGIHFYLSDFKLIDTATKAYGTSDTVTLRYASQNPLVVSDGYYKFNPSDGSTVSFLGDRTWKNSSNFSKVTFKLGVSNLASDAIATQFRSNHPLYFSTDSLWSSTLGYPHFGIKLKRDDSFKISEKIYAFGDGFDIEYSLDFNNVLAISPYQDLNSVKLTIDYLTLFKDVDIQASESVILSKIKENLKSAIQINQ